MWVEIGGENDFARLKMLARKADWIEFRGQNFEGTRYPHTPPNMVIRARADYKLMVGS